MSQDIKENKMGIMPVGKLLFTMSIPMIMSMLVQALYNIIDSVFVAMINEEALVAVSLAFPLQNLMIAIGVGTGVGVNALVSRHLGEKDFDRANSVATHAIRLAVISWAVIAVFTLAIMGIFFRFQSDDPVTVSYGMQYMGICAGLSLGLFFQLFIEKLLQSTGRTGLSMLVQMVGAVLNIVLDPLFIFGIGFFPKLGVAGAAVATVLGQWISAVMAIFINNKHNPEIKVSLRKYPFSKEIVKSIYAIGVPSIIMASIGSFMTLGFNKILAGFSATAIAVFGVYFKLQSFALMPVFGLNNGMIPIVAYNLGARKPDRIKGVFKHAVISAEMILFVCFLIFQIIPTQLLKMFSASEDMIALGVPALRIISSHFLLAGFCIVVSSMFQALGHGMISMIGSIMRQLLVLLPAAYILAKILGLGYLWWSFPIAEAIVLVFNVIMLKMIYRKQINPLYEKN